MGYFDLGMVLAIILSPIVIYYYITINNEMMELIQLGSQIVTIG